MDKKGLRIAFFGDSLTEGKVGASYFEILRQKLPEHELFNYGKGGDTVISLHRRIHKIGWNVPLDLGFLWIGTNDVLVKTSWFLPLRKRLRRQPWAKSHAQFREYYRSLLAELLNKMPFIFTLPPLLIGEDINNEWNVELAELSRLIRDISLPFPSVDFVDLRESFIQALKSAMVPSVIPKSIFRKILDILSAQNPGERLHFTIDGIHLNKAGASKVAEVLWRKIDAFSPGYPIP